MENKNQPELKNKNLERKPPIQRLDSRDITVGFSRIEIRSTPSAEEIEKLHKTNPEYASRIIAIAEDQLKVANKQNIHRMELENKTAEKSLTLNDRGQIFGFILTLLGLGLVGYFIYSGAPTQATFFGCGVVIYIASIFTLGKQDKKEKQDKKDKKDIKKQ